MRHPRPRTAGALASAGAVALLLSACSSGAPAATTPAASGGTGVTLLEPGKLKVCTHLSFKPFQYKDEAGKVVGFDVDLMDLVAKKLGATQEVVDIDFNSVTSGAAFAAKKCDVSAAAITITDARKGTIEFSEPYFDANQVLVVKKGAPYADLASLKGKKLAVQTDTSGQKYGEEQKAANGYTTVVFDDSVGEMNAILAGTVDGGLNDNAVANNFAKDNPQVAVVKEFQTNEKYGMAAKKGDTKMIGLVNDTLKAAKADGTFNTIYKKWFGVDAPKS